MIIMLMAKIKSAENSIPQKGFKIGIKGSMIAVLRDKNGNIKETREVEFNDSY